MTSICDAATVWMRRRKGTVLLLPILYVFSSSSATTSVLDTLVITRPSTNTWERKRCGPADQVTEWGRKVDPSRDVLAEFPRPLMTRPEGRNQWRSLNGLWEWQPASSSSTGLPALDRPLNRSILVPFPPESCLSGIAETHRYMVYRLQFAVDIPKHSKERIYLHFGAVDWKATVRVNGMVAVVHQGGYDGFSADITDLLITSSPASSILPGTLRSADKCQKVQQELLVFVEDPTDFGPQPAGKQRASAMDDPGGITYVATSGIWQTVWLEAVPAKGHITDLHINTDMESVTVKVTCSLERAARVAVVVTQDPDRGDGEIIAGGYGTTAEAVHVVVPSTNRRLWAPGTPELYGLRVMLLDDHGSEVMDEVTSYFGLRMVSIANVGGVVRPVINDQYTFLAGWLDQSYWPDGVYTAPSDEALAYDLQAALSWGLNTVRLHQKVNSERWYWHADRLGVLVIQDAPQKYGGAKNATVPLFESDLRALMTGPRSNHPSIIQWTLFNEDDCWDVFPDLGAIAARARAYDRTRLLDVDSGGRANEMHLADVDDVHHYPGPDYPSPQQKQYAMLGEFSGLVLAVKGKEWHAGRCGGYKIMEDGEHFADVYVSYLEDIFAHPKLSACIATQATDVECECNGFVNFDRTDKLDHVQKKRIVEAHRRLTKADQWNAKARSGTEAMVSITI